MKKRDYSIDARKECEHNQPFKKEFIEYICAPKEFEDVLWNMSFKGTSFSIFQQATQDDISSLGQAIGELDETFLNVSKKLPVALDFFHEFLLCTLLRTHFFQVQTCSNLDCLHRKPLRGDSPIRLIISIIICFIYYWLTK